MHFARRFGIHTRGILQKHVDAKNADSGLRPKFFYLDLSGTTDYSTYLDKSPEHSERVFRAVHGEILQSR